MWLLRWPFSLVGFEFLENNESHEGESVTLRFL